MSSKKSFVICHFSFVISHFSFVICHLSFVICHFSFVISHLSYVICHFSFVISHLSFLISHLSFLIPHLSYVICHISYVCSAVCPPHSRGSLEMSTWWGNVRACECVCVYVCTIPHWMVDLSRSFSAKNPNANQCLT